MPRTKVDINSEVDHQPVEPLDTTGIGEDSGDDFEQEREREIQAKDKHIAYLTEELKRISSVVGEMAQKNHVSTGEAQQIYFDAKSNLPYTIDGKRFAEWKKVSQYEETIGDTVETHYVYDVTFEKPDGTFEVENNVPYKRLALQLKNAVRVPVSIPKYLKRVQEGDHFVYRSVDALRGEPKQDNDDIEVLMGRFLADGKTEIYDQGKKTVKFYTLKAY